MRMRLGDPRRARAGFSVLLLCVVSACTLEVGQESDVSQVEQAATQKTLIAGRKVRLWSNLKRDRGAAHYRACENQPFKFTLTFRNKGSAIWRDVKGRGDAVGSDVFVETANGKVDTLTDRKRFSLRNNLNDYVRGDRKAHECSTKRGCRNTRAIKGGMNARAPNKPGIYATRWRLRDYSKKWNGGQGFGPKPTVRIRVVHCDPAPENCGCTVECSDGTSTKLWSAIESDAMCKSVAEGYCKPADYVGHQFVECGQPITPGDDFPGGYAGSPGDEDLEDPPNSWWIDEEDPSGSGGSGGSGAGGGAWWWDDDDEDPGIGIELPDDPDYQPDGFDGVAEEPPRGSVLESDSGCSASRSPAGSGLWTLAALGALGLVIRRRSVRSSRGRRSKHR
ncbi:MAG: hypothetical protein KC776_00425 [Myxococcales bacterium]|nr:hypothetical protein [Myxococcales bacterium]